MNLWNKYCARHVLGIGSKVENQTHKVLSHGAYIPEWVERPKIRKRMWDIISDVDVSYE